MALDKNTCLEIVNQIYPKAKCELLDWKMEKFEEKVGYHGSHNRLIMTVKINNETQALKFFVKNATDYEVIFNKYLRYLRCFEKEYHMLGSIIDKLETAVDEKLTAKCYKNKLDKFVVLEDLSELGYTCDVNIKRDFTYVEKTVEKLAVFHSASFILEHQTSKTPDLLFPEINFECFVNNSNISGHISWTTSTMVKHCINQLQDIPNRHVFGDWLLNKVDYLVRPSLKYKNVLCHGDPWGMNFMYKFKGTELQDVLMVDFQFSRIAPPALELTQYLGMVYRYDEIKKIKNKIIDVYYNKMNQVLSKNHINISEIFPKSELTETFDFYMTFGLGAALKYSVIILLPSEINKRIDTPEKFLKLMIYGDPEVTEEAFSKYEGYRDRITDLIRDCYQHYLDVRGQDC